MIHATGNLIRNKHLAGLVVQNADALSHEPKNHRSHHTILFAFIRVYSRFKSPLQVITVTATPRV